MFADEDDLAALKAAAARRGIAEAELIRDAIHIEAMANRRWAEPFFTHTYSSSSEGPHPGVDDVLGDEWAEKAEAYERTKNRPR